MMEGMGGSKKQCSQQSSSDRRRRSRRKSEAGTGLGADRHCRSVGGQWASLYVGRYSRAPVFLTTRSLCVESV